MDCLRTESNGNHTDRSDASDVDEDNGHIQTKSLAMCRQVPRPLLVLKPNHLNSTEITLQRQKPSVSWLYPSCMDMSHETYAALHSGRLNLFPKRACFRDPKQRALAADGSLTVWRTSFWLATTARKITSSHTRSLPCGIDRQRSC